MTRRQRVEFARRIIEMPVAQFQGIITRLIQTKQYQLAQEISKQLKKKVADRKVSLAEKDGYLEKAEIVTCEIEGVVAACEQYIVDVADYIDRISEIE